MTNADAVPVLVNPAGGTASRARDGLADMIRRAAREAGVAIDLRFVVGRDMASTCAGLRACPLVVVGGGDGTLGCAAGALAGSGTALGLLPLGTRNHLAMALGIPADLGEAMRLLVDRPIQRIDVARVNGRAFVNNASIGFYPAMVEARDAARARHGWAPKWLAAVPAGWRTLMRIRHHRLRLAAGEGVREIVTPLLFVGNNRYDLSAGHLGERASLSDGLLSVYAVASRHRRALVGLTLRALAGRVRPGDFSALGETASLKVAGRSRHVRIALDGEVVRLSLPLQFSIEAEALRVVAPLSRPTASPKSDG